MGRQPARLDERLVEAWPMARMWFSAQRVKVLPKDSYLAFCYEILNRVSRSFAIVIQQLPTKLRDSVCIYYLVLRALDTVEDDMAIAISKKVPLLKAFHKNMDDREYSLECGTKEYLRLMRNYPQVTHAYLRLPQSHQQAIKEITRDMGAGMAEFIERDVETVKDYDLYCYYVAGLVGIGLSKLFRASGLESFDPASVEDLSNDMGQFLQKTNIIRDYLEDIVEEPAPRMFWPREIWGRYATDLADFKSEENSAQAVKALNHMITDALRHAPQSLQYMSKLRNRRVFRFCAIPQVMAIATLAEIYNNPDVFKGVVKVRRGVVARYMLGLDTEADLLRAFKRFADAIADRCMTEARKDPIADVTLKRARAVASHASEELRRQGQPVVLQPDWIACFVRMVIIALLASLIIRMTPSMTAFHVLIVAPCSLVAAVFMYSSAHRL